MKNKGVVWGVLIILMLVAVATFSLIAYTGFEGNIAFRKRALEEEILNIGNEMETDARLIGQVGKFIAWQVLHDVGRGVILDPIGDFYYDESKPGLANRLNLMPFWENVPRDRIINSIKRAAANHFTNYIRDINLIYKQLNNNPVNRFIDAKRNAAACASTGVTVNPGNAVFNFGDVTFQYSSKRIDSIEIDNSVSDSVTTNFGIALSVSQNIINELKDLVSPPKLNFFASLTNGNTYDFFREKTKPSDPDIKAIIIPPQEIEHESDSVCCYSSKIGKSQWYNGINCPIGYPVNIVNCEWPGCGSSKNCACGNRCSGSDDYKIDDPYCTCIDIEIIPGQRKIEFLGNAQGTVRNPDIDCKEQPYTSSTISIPDSGAKICVKTKEWDVKPSCTKEEEVGDAYCKVLNSQDSACELHTATVDVGVNGWSSITLQGSYENVTILQQNEAKNMGQKFSGGVNVDIDACNGFAYILAKEGNTVPLYSFNQGGIGSENIGTEFLVDNEVKKWTAEPPKFKLNEVKGYMYADTDLPLRTGLASALLLYGPAPNKCKIPIDCGGSGEKLFNGVTYMKKTVTYPRNLVLHIVKVDLDEADIDLMVTPRNQLGKTTSRFLSDNKLQLAINGGTFAGSTPNGLAASEGDVYANPEDRDLNVYISKSNEVTIDGSSGSIWDAVDGQNGLVKNGDVWPSVKDCLKPDVYCSALHPRTSVGITEDNQLIIIVVDGRQPGYSEGVTLFELAGVMLTCNVENALNLDGGGSSTLVAEGYGVLNSPSDPGERVVANHLGIFAKK